MKSIKLYKILQKHVSTMNSIAVKLYNDEMGTDEALKQAKEETARISTELKEKK